MKSTRIPVTEIALAIVLVISIVVFVGMLNNSDIETSNNPETRIGYTQYAVADVDTENMYTFQMNMAKESFEKYQIKSVGDEAAYYISMFNFPGSVKHLHQKNVSGKQSVTLLDATVADSFKGKSATEGMKYVVVTLTAANELEEDYILGDYAFNVGVMDEDYIVNQEIEVADCELSDGMVRYELVTTEDALKVGGIFSVSDEAYTGYVLLPKDTIITYKLAYLVSEEDIASGKLVWGRLTAKRKHNANDTRYYNDGFLYKILN